jgi:aryl-alcohol dehydrogenase-like predicted oxidoreductase
MLKKIPLPNSDLQVSEFALGAVPWGTAAHRDDRRVPVSEILHTLNDEVARNRIRHFGVSNWRPARIAEANAYAEQHNLQPFICSQPQFSLAHPNTPEAGDDLALRFLTSADIQWHEQTQFPAFCYSPTAQGYFATDGKAASNSYENPTSRARLIRAQQLATAHNATPTQIALAWLRHQNFPAIPLLGTSNPGHLKEALAAADLSLTSAELTSLC